VSNVNFLNMGVDNVSINFTAVNGVPEPSSMVLSALGVMAFALMRLFPLSRMVLH
jgi:hypothetical protein